MADDTPPETLRNFKVMADMAGAVAHDFNNLLTGILGNLELLQRRAAKRGLAEFDDYLQGSRNAANRAVDLTRRLLAVSGHQQLDPSVHDTGKLIENMRDLLQAALGPDITLRLDLAAVLWPISCDEAYLEDALLNLVRNARQAIAGAGTVTLSLRNRTIGAAQAGGFDMPPGDYIEISLTDSGPGMTAEVASRAFEPFFSTRNAGAGAGLGLATVLGFARQSGGHATITDAAAGTTTITLYVTRG